MSGDIKFIKLSVNMFDDEKIRIIERMPEGDQILIIWIKLLAMAGRANLNGWIMITESMAYTEEMLSSVMSRDIGVVRLALDTFERFQMIERTESNAIHIKNWDKHQAVDRMNKIREDQRLRKAKSREKSRLIGEGITPQEAEKMAHQAIYGGGDLSRDLSRDVTTKKEEIRNKNKDINNNVEDQDLDDLDEKNQSKKKKREYTEDSIEYRLAAYLYKRILENNPEHKKPDLQKWADVIRLMIERDGRDPKRIAQVIDWVQSDSFWMGNILSTDKLRKQWDKLIIQIKTRGGGSNGGTRGRYGSAPPASKDYEDGADGLFYRGS